MTQFLPEDIKKNSIIALYADEKEDNNGLPFFLRKVLRVFNKNEKDDDADEDGEESDEAPEYLVDIHEYIQTKINGQPSGKYIPHNEHGEAKKGSKTTKAKAVTVKVEIAQSAFLLEKMNNDESLPNPTMKLLSFNCKVAAHREIFKCTGRRKFALGSRFGPQTIARARKIRSHCRLKLFKSLVILLNAPL